MNSPLSGSAEITVSADGGSPIKEQDIICIRIECVLSNELEWYRGVLCLRLCRDGGFFNARE